MVKIRAQMKIQQTAFMLIAVTLFFVLVGLFVLGFKLSDLKEKATELDKKNTMLLASKLANSPEFTCGNSFENKINCIDADKVMMLKGNINKYHGFWGVSDIKIRRIYPESEERVCTVSNYPDCNVINLISEETVGTYFGNFVSLCRKESKTSGFYNKCELARLMISYEKRK